MVSMTRLDLPGFSEIYPVKGSGEGRSASKD